MKKSKAETAETRRRIVDAAAGAFLNKGVAGAGLSEIMAAADLTVGGFYRHFETKDDLVAEAVRTTGEALAGRLEAETGEARSRAALSAAVTRYLSPAHRDNPATGCPLAALAGELGRGEPVVKMAAAGAFDRLAGVLAAADPEPGSEGARDRAAVSVATMVGALVLARLLGPSEASDTLLAEARSRILDA